MKILVDKMVQGFKTKDGAGVNLVRVLGHDTVKDYDPILMLDSFDSEKPDDYTAGFPMHPHRGIETISYVYKGKMVHKDSLGNQDTIQDGEVQWMTAGSGILHEEQVPAVEKLLGVQLWLNLPAKDKMVAPEYRSIKNDEIKEFDIENGKLRLLAGEYKEHKGYKSKYLPVNYYDIHLDTNACFELEVLQQQSCMIFTLQGEVYIEGERIKEKTAAKLSEGKVLQLKTKDKNAQILFVSSVALKEPVVWGGPIVMNTKQELEKAYEDLREGTFLQKEIVY